MKPKPNQNRGTRRAFNGIDAATGYAVRFERTKSGSWCSLVRSFIALSCAPSLRTVKRHTSKAIGYHFEGCLADGLPIPKPKGKVIAFRDEDWPCLVTGQGNQPPPSPQNADRPGELDQKSAQQLTAA